MKSYPKYKPSKIVWYPEIPENWDYCKAKHIANTYAGGTPSTVVDSFWHNGDIPWLPSGKLQNCEITSAEKFITQEGLNGSSTKWIKPNTVLVALTGATCANIGYLTFQACANQSVIAIDENPEKANSRFLYYMFLNMRSQILTHQTGGAQAGINDSDVKNLYLLKPSLEEQIKIADYLDYKTNLIDATIEKKKRLIELLKEKRQAVINEAVTKGLNPNAPMKDSGVEWLGEIPDNWEVKKVKYLLSSENGIKIGPFGSALKLDTLTDKGIKIYGQGNVIKDDFTLGHRYIDPERFEKDFKQYEILDGDILITMMGTTGKSKVFNSSYEKGILDSHLLRLRFNEDLFDGRLFSILLEQSDYVFQQLALNSVGSIMAGLNSSIVKELSIVTPKLEIQKEILNYIDDNCKIIDTISSKILSQIEKLQTYRQSLISEAVTGKIDVRAWHNPKNK